MEQKKWTHLNLLPFYFLLGGLTINYLPQINLSYKIWVDIYYPLCS